MNPRNSVCAHQGQHVTLSLLESVFLKKAVIVLAQFLSLADSSPNLPCYTSPISH